MNSDIETDIESAALRAAARNRGPCYVPRTDKWPPGISLLFIGAVSVALWAMIIGGAVLLIEVFR